MLRIKVIDPKSNFRLNLPLPYHFLINIGVRKTWANIAIRRSNFEDEKTYNLVKGIVESLDFGALRGALHDLTLKRGFALVDVQANDGTIVKITT